jgi:hypothetical protein
MEKNMRVNWSAPTHSEQTPPFRAINTQLTNFPHNYSLYNAKLSQRLNALKLSLASSRVRWFNFQ